MKSMKPVLARPWVHIHNPMDLGHVPAWLSPKQLHYAGQLFGKRIHAHPILVAETLHKMKGESPQVVVAGRSNVGKSTLLNMLLHGQPDPLGKRPGRERKKLDLPHAAPVSHKPGRTRHLFRFEIGGSLTLVDIPGYGYASAPRDTRQSWATLIDEYLRNARNIQRVISLVDARDGVKDSDEQLWDMLQEQNKQLMVVLTKVDKVSALGLNRTMAHVVSLLQGMEPDLIWPYVHAVSGLHGHGIDELRASLSAVASDHQFKL